YLLLVPEKVEQAEGEEIAQREEELVEGRSGPAPAVSLAAAAGPLPEVRTTQASPPALRIIGSTFGIIVLAEFGDITQVLLANLTAHYHDPLSVFLGSAVGFCLVAVVGVLAGAVLTRRVPLALVRKRSGAPLGGFGIYTVVSLISV